MHSKDVCLRFSFFLSFLLTYFRACSSDCTISSSKKGDFRGMFVFGSSVDNGNNNHLNTTFKANYPPYGIDFPFGATGRFSNGKNFADQIGDLLKLPLIPAFGDPKTKGIVISQGVNYASAGSGILDETGSNLGVISLNQQIQNFAKVTLPDLKAQNPGCQAKDVLQNYLFLFLTGSDDFMSNYFHGRTRASLEYFAINLTSSIEAQLKILHNLGARKFALLNLGPLGCTPVVKATVPKNECNEAFNYASFFFNIQLVQMLDVLKPKLPDFQSVVINFFQIVLQYIRNPSDGGFNEVGKSCCEVAVESGGVLCKPNGSVCSNRSSYIYFDGVHNSEAMYGIAASKAYNSDMISEVYPFNIQKLAHV